MDSKDKLVTLEDLKVVHDEVARYTTCSTAASTAAKTAALTNFVLTTGSAVKVKFTNTNTAANPTLNVNSTGAKEIYINATTAAGTYARTSWAAGAVVTLVYDGSHWIIVRTGDASVMAMTPILLTENTDLDTVTTAGTYRVWGAYTNAPTTNNIYGVLTVSGIPGALIQMYQSCTAANSFFRGYTNSQWYPWKQLMINSGGIFNGTLFIDRKDGTTSTTGTSTLWLGNSTPTGTDENSKGQVVLYGNGANYINIQATNATGNRTVELPNANGTIALKEPINLNTTDDLNSLNQPNQSGMYYIQSSAVNAPTVWASLEVIARPSGGCTQIVTSTNGIWVRQYTGSPLAWSIWRQYKPNDAYEDVSVTTGTTQYAGYYYADGSTSLSGVKSVSIYGTTSNRPAFVQMITEQTFRVFSPVASTTATVRITY